MNAVVNSIKAIDNRAFISVSSAKSVYGEGFEEVRSGVKLNKKKKEKDKVEINETNE